MHFVPPVRASSIYNNR